MPKREFILLTLAHYLPVLCAVLFYRGGGLLLWPLFLILQGGLISLDERRCPTRKLLAFFCGNLLVSTALAHVLSTWLYYTRVSSDFMSKAVGSVGLHLGILVVLVLSAVALGMYGRKRS